MRPIRFGVELLFADEKNTYPLSHIVAEALGGRTTTPPPPLPSQMNLRIEKNKESIIWSPSTCVVTVENILSRDDFIKEIISHLEVINRVAPIRKLKERTFFSNWILPTPKLDFASLERKYRETMVARNDIISAAYDSSVILDGKVDDLTLHHQSGPMEPEQLFRNYLKFGLNDAPKTFVFLDACIFYKREIEYTGAEFQDFLRRSLDICFSHSEGFGKIWEGVL